MAQCKVGASMSSDYYEHAAECPDCEAHEAARRGDYIHRLCNLLALGRRILAHPHKAMELAEHVVRIASEGGAVNPGLLRDAAPVGEPAPMPTAPETPDPSFVASCEGCPYPDTCSWFRRCTFRRIAGASEFRRPGRSVSPPEMPEILVGDTIAHGRPMEPLQFMSNVTEYERRGWQNDPNVVMVLRPIWRRTDRKEPTK